MKVRRTSLCIMTYIEGPAVLLLTVPEIAAD